MRLAQAAPLLVLIVVLACDGEADEAAPPDRDYEVVVRRPSGGSGTGGDSQATLPPPDATLGGTPPGSDQTVGGVAPGAGQQAVGWVTVTASDQGSYPVHKDGRQVGRTMMEVTQRPGGTALYEVRDDGGRVRCRATQRIAEFESACLECDLREGRFRRVQCPGM